MDSNAELERRAGAFQMFSANFGFTLGLLTVLIILARLPLCSGEAAWFAASEESHFLKDYVRGDWLKLKTQSQDMQPGPVKSFQKEAGRCQSHTQSWHRALPQHQGLPLNCSGKWCCISRLLNQLVKKTTPYPSSSKEKSLIYKLRVLNTRKNNQVLEDFWHDESPLSPRGEKH